MSVSQLQLLESTWESEIQKGNCFFQSSASSKAYLHYMQAMIISEVLMENITISCKHSLRTPGMYYTACVNLANNYWGMQDIENAERYFLYCTYKLKVLADKPGANLLLKERSTGYWQKAVQVYIDFSDKTGTSIPVDLTKDKAYVQLQKLKNLFMLSKEKLN